MFCSSLRRRREWAPAVHALSRAADPGWRETTLESHDVAFPLPAREHGSPTMFRILLLPTSGANTPEAAARIDRLSMLDGNGKAAVILLFADSDDTASFMELQMRMLDAENSVAIIPITSATDLVPCLDSLRRECNKADSAVVPTHDLLRARELLSHCSRGPRLTTNQTNILSDVCTGFADLARHAYDPTGQRKIADDLGDAEALRVVSFFTSRP